MDKSIAIKECIDRDLFLRKFYLSEKNRGAPEEVLKDILDRIIENKNEYNELITIDIDGGKTSKYKIKKIEDLDSKKVVFKSITTVFWALVAAGLIVAKNVMDFPSYKQVIATIGFGAGIFRSLMEANDIVYELIKRSRYKKEIEKIIEEIESNEDELKL